MKHAHLTKRLLIPILRIMRLNGNLNGNFIPVFRIHIDKNSFCPLLLFEWKINIFNLGQYLLDHKSKINYKPINRVRY